MLSGIVLSSSRIAGIRMDAHAPIIPTVEVMYHPSFGWVFGALLLLSFAEMYWNTKYDVVKWYNPAGGSITYEASVWQEFKDEWRRLRFDSAFVKPFKMFEWMSTMYVDVYFKKLFRDYQLDSENKYRRFVHRRRQFTATVSAVLLMVSALAYYLFPAICVVTLFTFCSAVVLQLLLLFAVGFEYQMAKPYRPRKPAPLTYAEAIAMHARDVRKGRLKTHAIAALTAAVGAGLSAWYACILEVPLACSPFTILVAAVCGLLVAPLSIRWMGLFYTPPPKA